MIAVCGAGAAGTAAALAAARAGRDVVLVEARTDVGGTLANALLHTIAGLYDAAGDYVNDGLARELAERLLAADAHVRRRRMGKVWVLNVDPELYRSVIRSWLHSEPRVRMLFATQVTGVTREGNRVTELALGGSGTSETSQRLDVRSVVDATGTAAVLARIDGALRVDDARSGAAGLVLKLRAVAPGTLAFPRNVALVRSLREEAQKGSLPEECLHGWLDTGVYDDEVYVKLLVRRSSYEETGSGPIGVSGERARVAEQVLAFLKRQSGFAGAHLAQIGEVGVRDGGRAVGEYVLTRSDVLELRRFDDPACRCSWPIEYWDESHGVTLEYLPEGGYYEIPLRALTARGIENAWVAGKCLSADKYAQASARTVGTCWAMGEAVGAAAARR